MLSRLIGKRGIRCATLDTQKRLNDRWPEIIEAASSSDQIAASHASVLERRLCDGGGQ
jgi:hypothetical protein